MAKKGRGGRGQKLTNAPRKGRPTDIPGQPQNKAGKNRGNAPPRKNKGN